MIFLYLSLIDNQEDYALFEHIYLTYRTQMHRVALSIMGNDTEAEDVVHDVFYSIAEKYIDTVKNINSEDGIRNYLLKSVKNTAYNRLKHMRHNAFSIDAVSENDYSSIPELSDNSFWDTLCSQLEYEKLVNAIISLEDKYRLVLYNHLILGFTFAEIAKQTNEKPATIRKQFSRGKVLLIDLINESKGANNNDKR